MGLGLLSQILKNFLFFCLFLIFIPGIPPHVNFSYVQLDPIKPLEGPLAKNYILDDAERLYEGHLTGPESVASRQDDEIFVSVHGGDIVKIWGKNFENNKVVTNIGPGCAGFWEEHICGRPLGLRFGNDGKLFVADAYFGIFAVDVDTGKKELLINASEPIEGLKPLLVDDLDIDDAGNIYWSDASTVANLGDSLIELSSDPSGRLIKYDVKTKKNIVLLNKVHFGNGVQLSPDQSFVLISETCQHRVLRYWLKGPNAGKSDVFVSGLPGMPDNIRPRLEGGYYVSLVAPKDPEAVDLYAVFAKLPYIRKLLSRSFYIAKLILEQVNLYYPNEFAARGAYKVFNFDMLKSLIDVNLSIIVELNENGDIIGSLQGHSGRIVKVSETVQVGDNLFFGSPFNKYLGRLKLQKTKTPSSVPSAEKKTPSSAPSSSYKKMEEKLSQKEEL